MFKMKLVARVLAGETTSWWEVVRGMYAVVSLKVVQVTAACEYGGRRKRGVRSQIFEAL